MVSFSLAERPARHPMEETYRIKSKKSLIIVIENLKSL